MPGVICNIVVKADTLADLPSPGRLSRVDLNGNFGFLPLELIKADHFGQIYPPSELKIDAWNNTVHRNLADKAFFG